jgi:hypothetical protein
MPPFLVQVSTARGKMELAQLTALKESSDSHISRTASDDRQAKRLKSGVDIHPSITWTNTYALSLLIQLEVGDAG